MTHSDKAIRRESVDQRMSGERYHVLVKDQSSSKKEVHYLTGLAFSANSKQPRTTKDGEN